MRNSSVNYESNKSSEKCNRSCFLTAWIAMLDKEGYIECVCVCVCVLPAQSCPTLCDPMQSSSVHGNLQARIPEWVVFPSPRDLPNPGLKPESLMSLALAGRFFTTSTT